MSHREMNAGVDGIGDEALQAYLDGQADDATRARIDAARLRDPALDEAIVRDERMRARLRGAFDEVLEEPVPEALRAMLERPAPQAARVVDLAARREARWRVPVYALAASLALVAAAWWLRPADTAPWAREQGALVARGDFARALETALASAPADGLRVGVTFRDRAGRWCRSFDGVDGAWQGLACRDGEAWRVEVLAHAPASGGEVQQASAGMSPAVLAAIDARIDGEAMDAAGERAAVASGWARPR